MDGCDDSGSDLGTLLRRHRVARGLTQEELAHLSALSVRAIADMERGRTARPYRRSVQRLADALGLSGPDRDWLQRVARAPAVPALPSHGPGHADEFTLLTNLLLAVARAGGSLTVSAVTPEGELTVDLSKLAHAALGDEVDVG